MNTASAGFNPSEVGLLAECSWEVCNKIGGIYTVLSTKAVELHKTFGDRLVFIGPDFKSDEADPCSDLFKEHKTLLNRFSSKKLPLGLSARVGRWNIPGSPLVVLVDFKPIFPLLNGFYGEMWQSFGVDSLHAYGDYDESCAFAIAAAEIIRVLADHLGVAPSGAIAHFNEWTTGMGLLYLRLRSPKMATIFTTHATTIGRSICGNGKALYEYFDGYNGDQMAGELNVQSKHSLEKAAAHNADCFTTVSDVTARECEQLLGKRPDVVTPNGFEPSFVPGTAKWNKLRAEGRGKILKVASGLQGATLPDDTFIVATSGRNEFRNKGLDLFLDSMARLAEKTTVADPPVLALVLVPAWVKEPSASLETGYLTHRLHNEDSDPVASTIRRLKADLEAKGLADRLKFVFVPSYLDGHDGIVDISYYDLLPGIDLSVFASYYEPWGYTPLESIAFGVPTVTTDKAGFGEWALEQGDNSPLASGVAVMARCDSNYTQCRENISDIALGYMHAPASERKEARKAAMLTARKAEWKFFIKDYFEAFATALGHAAARNRL